MLSKVNFSWFLTFIMSNLDFFFFIFDLFSALTNKFFIYGVWNGHVELPLSSYHFCMEKDQHPDTRAGGSAVHC